MAKVDACFPMLERMLTADAGDRRQEAGQLNLKSCELLHPKVLAWVSQALATIDPAAIVCYPNTDQAIQQIAISFDRAFDSVTLTPGTEQAIHLVVESLGVPSGRLLVATPRFDGWDRAAVRFDVPLTNIPMADGEVVAADQLIDRMRLSGPCVVVLTQPDGVTGKVLPRDDVINLAGAVAEHGSLLVIDTCYLPFVHGESTGVPEVQCNPSVIRIQSFSKCLGLAGGRIGAIFASAEITKYLRRWRQERLISGVSLALLQQALQNGDFFDTIYADVRAARSRLALELPQLLPGWTPIASQASFVAFRGPARPERGALMRIAGLAESVRTKSLREFPGFNDGLRIATPSRAAVDTVLKTLALPTPGGR
jgi:histidinol-phosphate aminotransferase